MGHTHCILFLLLQSAPSAQSLARFVEREYGSAPRPPSAAERKLARNRTRMAPIDSSSDTLAQENTFELVAAGPTDPKKEKISLAGKPMRPAGAAEQVRKINKKFLMGPKFDFPPHFLGLFWRSSPFSLGLFHLIFLVRLFCFALMYFYTAEARDKEDTSLSGPCHISDNFLLPSAPNSVINFNSESVINFTFTNLTSVSGIP